MRAPTWSVALAGILVLPAAGASACSPQDIQIKQWTWQRDAGWVTVAGELVNTCADATGIKLQLTFRDESGAVVDVDETWLAGTRNIAAGETYAFQRKVRAYATTKSTALRVSDVRRWDSLK